MVKYINCFKCNDNGRISNACICDDVYSTDIPVKKFILPDLLYSALRQYRHNNGNGFVFGYDKEEVNKIVASLLLKLNKRGDIMEKLKQSDLKVGDSVRYQPAHYDENEWENGVVKGIPKHTTKSVRVVYNCAGEWHRYQDFTSAMTSLKDLKKGWR